MVIKGTKDTITKALDEIKWHSYIHEETLSENGITTMRIELEDPDIDTKSFELNKYDDLKYIILVHPNGSYTDVIVFKDFGNDEIIIKNAYNTRYTSIYAEELEGVLFFPDSKFEYSFEDYSCGEMVDLKYKFSVKEQWEDDSSFFQ